MMQVGNYILNDRFFLDLATGRKFDSLEGLKEIYGSNQKVKRAFAEKKIVLCFGAGTKIEKTK